MPYTASSVPDYVPKSKAKAWAAVWNAAYAGALKDGKSKEKAEEYAFAVANAKQGPNSKKAISIEDLADSTSFQELLEKLVDDPFDTFGFEEECNETLYMPEM